MSNNATKSLHINHQYSSLALVGGDDATLDIVNKAVDLRVEGGALIRKKLVVKGNICVVDHFVGRLCGNIVTEQILPKDVSEGISVVGNINLDPDNWFVGNLATQQIIPINSNKPISVVGNVKVDGNVDLNYKHISNVNTITVGFMTPNNIEGHVFMNGNLDFMCGNINNTNVIHLKEIHPKNSGNNIVMRGNVIITGVFETEGDLASNIMIANTVCAYVKMQTDVLEPKTLGGDITINGNIIIAGESSFENITGNNITGNIVSGLLVEGDTVCADVKVQTDVLEPKTLGGDITINGNIIISEESSFENITGNNITGNIVSAPLIDADVVCANVKIQTDLIEPKTSGGDITMNADVSIVGVLNFQNVSANTITGNIVSAPLIDADVVCANVKIQTDLIESKTDDANIVMDGNVCIGDTLYVSNIQGKSPVTVNNDLIVQGNLFISGSNNIIIPSTGESIVTVFDANVAKGDILSLTSIGATTNPGNIDPTEPVWYLTAADNGNRHDARDVVYFDGNVYVAGTAQSEITIGGLTVGNLNPSSFWIAKIDEVSQNAYWLETVTSPDGQIYTGFSPDDIGIDCNGNVYIGVGYKGNIEFGNTFSFASSSDATSAFQQVSTERVFAKLTNDGEWEWTSNIYGILRPGEDTMSVFGAGLCVDKMTGNIYGMTSFTNGNLVAGDLYGNTASGDVLISKINGLTGEIEWVLQSTRPGSGGTSVIVDGNDISDSGNDMYLSGSYFGDDIEFGGNTLPGSTVKTFTYITKVDVSSPTSGSFAWAARMYDPLEVPFPDKNNELDNGVLTIDTTGNIIIAADMTGNLTFESVSLANTIVMTQGTVDSQGTRRNLMVAKISADGEWLNTITTTSTVSSPIPTPKNIHVDQNDNLFITGWIITGFTGGVVDFDEAGVIDTTTTAQTFIVQIDTDLTAWAQLDTFNAQNGGNSARNDVTGEIYIDFSYISFEDDVIIRDTVIPAPSAIVNMGVTRANVSPTGIITTLMPVIALEDATIGSNVLVHHRPGDAIDCFVGLSPLKTYYYDTSLGSITETDTGNILGFALNSTTLIYNPEPSFINDNLGSDFGF